MHNIEWTCLSLSSMSSHCKVRKYRYLLPFYRLFYITGKYTYYSFVTFSNWNNIFRQSRNLHGLWRIVKFDKQCIEHPLFMRSTIVLPTNNKSLLSFCDTKFCCIIISDHDRHSNTKRQFSCKILSSSMMQTPNYFLSMRTDIT